MSAYRLQKLTSPVDRNSKAFVVFVVVIINQYRVNHFLSNNFPKILLCLRFSIVLEVLL